MREVVRNRGFFVFFGNTNFHCDEDHSHSHQNYTAGYI